MDHKTTDNWQKVKQNAIKQLPAPVVAFIEHCAQQPHPKSQLIAVLHKVQDHFGYLGEAQLDAVSQLLRVPQATVAGVASFYHYFRLTPRGKTVIRICLGTACYVKGGEKVAERFKQELGIEFGETTKDGLFSLEPTRCLGTCGLAPVVMIEDEIYGRITPDQIPGLIEKLMTRAQSTESNDTTKDKGEHHATTKDDRNA